jgi:hypothetical protein
MTEANNGWSLSREPCTHRGSFLAGASDGLGNHPRQAPQHALAHPNNAALHDLPRRLGCTRTWLPRVSAMLLQAMVDELEPRHVNLKQKNSILSVDT